MAHPFQSQAFVKALLDDPTQVKGLAKLKGLESIFLAYNPVADINRIANPIKLARRVLADSKHVMLAGPGALRFARSRGIRNGAFASARRPARRQWRNRR